MKIILFNKKTNSTILLRAFLGGNFIKFGVITLLFLIGFYIFQVSNMTQKTYAIQTYHKEIRDVMENNRNKEYDFLRSNSLSRVESLIKDSDFERINIVHHIEITEDQIALIF